MERDKRVIVFFFLSFGLSTDFQRTLQEDEEEKEEEEEEEAQGF